jgi:FOG: HPt domain
MDSYLAKPVSKDALLALVARFVKNRRAMTASLTPLGDVSAAEPTLDPTVIDELRVLGEAAEQDLLDEVIDQFVHDTEPLLVQLREAFEVDDPTAVGSIAHGLKGSCGQLGGRRLASSCARLEEKATAGSLSNAVDDLLDVEVDYQELRRALRHEVSSIDRRHTRSLHA